MTSSDKTIEITPLPPGRWGLAASAGADSTALLLLLLQQPGSSLHILHLNHETRGRDSDHDAQFVAELAQKHNLPFTIARRSEIEPSMPDLPSNPSARYRAVRLEFFRRAAEKHQLQAVLLAHHSDDQAETILHRLLRASGPPGLAGMKFRSLIHGVTLLRPLLDVSRESLRNYLVSRNQPWREDASNASPKYLRNRLRPLLHNSPSLKPALLQLAASCRDLHRWIAQTAPSLDDEFRIDRLFSLPIPLARQSARNWLKSRGVPPAQLDPHAIERLITLASDAASPSSINLPSSLIARRRAGKIFAARIS